MVIGVLHERSWLRSPSVGGVLGCKDQEQTWRSVHVWSAEHRPSGCKLAARPCSRISYAARRVCGRLLRAAGASAGCCTPLLYSARPILAAIIRSVDCVARADNLPISLLSCQDPAHWCAVDGSVEHCLAAKKRPGSHVSPAAATVRFSGVADAQLRPDVLVVRGCLRLCQGAGGCRRCRHGCRQR